jgi:phosphate starvation-inducible PhoH-like protein
MFLTRLGFASKMIVTGDPSQTDLKNSRESGLNQVLEILKDMEDIRIITFDKLDVVRHPLVQHILERYDKHES